MIKSISEYEKAGLEKSKEFILNSLLFFVFVVGLRKETINM